ncbi:MAG: fasciclin domain-containing protein [Paludibacter sp.]
MKKKNLSFIFSIVLLFLVSLYSCTDNWETHYSPVSGEKSDLNLYQYIKAQDSLSIFSKMLSIAGYDSILSKSQTYTVWAPVNSALESINLKDTSLVVEIVKNHIARFSYTTSGLTAKPIFMLANKIVPFAGNGSTYTFGGKRIVKSNIATVNGIIHYIENYVPYLSNIWEYIGKTAGLDSLKRYLYSNSKFEFDLAASGNDIGTDAHGQLLYDSVFVFTNKIMNRLGAFNTEDSLYTAILPNNTAWDEAYSRIKPYYNTLLADGGPAKQRQYTQWSIFQDLIFRKQVPNPSAFDSLVSTNGNVFQKPSYLFNGIVPTPVSNGIAYITDKLTHNATDSWHKEIRVEAESVSFTELGSKANFDPLPRTSFGTGFSLSGDKYIYCQNLTTTDFSIAFVKFPIPNTLSAKYNIYCVFVPTNIVNATDTLTSKVKFYLSYMDVTKDVNGFDTRIGKQIVDAPIDANNKVLAVGKTAAIFTTNSNKKTEIFVTQFEFKYSNLLDYENLLTSVATVKLRVENATKKAETTKSTKDMRIDCIILKPVL